MRKIKIVNNTSTDPARRSRKFVDDDNNNDEVLEIKCTYDPTQICFPDCAACEIVSQAFFSKAICGRGNFEIGMLQ